MVFAKCYANHHTNIKLWLFDIQYIYIDRLLFQNSEMKMVLMMAWMMAEQTQTQMMKVHNTIITS